MELDIASTAEGSTEYSLVSALITSDRMQSEVEICGVVTEFVIYEHIEKPYLTMRLSYCLITSGTIARLFSSPDTVKSLGLHEKNNSPL